MTTLVTQKRRAKFNYDILETLEAGVVLHGFEVKSLKQKQGSLEGAYVVIRGDEAFLISMRIPPYQQANTPKDYDEYRVRKLLLSKKEIKRLAEKEGERGLTLVPISVYNKNRHIKLEIAIARGKKKTDKRQTIKKREADIDIQRTLKNQ